MSLRGEQHSPHLFGERKPFIAKLASFPSLEIPGAYGRILYSLPVTFQVSASFLALDAGSAECSASGIASFAFAILSSHTHGKILTNTQFSAIFY